jgi:hypothetical protein
MAGRDEKIAAGPVHEIKRGRWFHITPDRLVIGLLAAEGSLLLAEWLRWIPKGWPVLIAIAAVAAAMLLMLVWFVVALLFRRRFQFSIRALLLLVAVVAVPCSWMMVELKEAKEQEAVAKLDGAWAFYDWQVDANGDQLRFAEPPGPTWLRRLLGDDFLANVVWLRPDGTATDVDMEVEHIKALAGLKGLDLSQTQVTNAELELLMESLPQLHDLSLGGTQVTSAGLKNLNRLTQLQGLWLVGTGVTDAGLEQLKGLTQLKQLNLMFARVTDAGLNNLEGLKQLQKLDLSNTQVTDDGLEHLKGLTQLNWLSLNGCPVTDAGLEYMKGLRELRRLELDGTKITDAGLEHLKALKRLDNLRLNNTKVSDAGVKKLKQALPTCKIVH